MYQLDTWSRNLNTGFILKNCFFGSVKLTENDVPAKYIYIYIYIYSGFGTGFDSHWEF